MKWFVYAVAAALLSMADNASAADMARKAPSAQKQDPCATSRFSGVYAGGNVGAIAYTALRGDWNELRGDAEAYSANKIGATAGVQAGYDWQSCNKVFGIVADFNWADTATTARLNPNATFATDLSFASNMHWFSTVRARAGLAVNDTLFYVTGGLAVANVTSTVNNFLVGSPTNGKFVFHDTRWGLAGGVGAEFALWNNWSLNTELLYLQFERETDTVRLPASSRTPGIENNDSAWIARIGLNYRPDNPRTSYASAASVSPGPCGPARFNGGYVGGTAGAMGMTSLRGDQDSNNGFLMGADNSATGYGFVGGAQIGWDWQACNKVFGIVADWNWTDVDTTIRIRPDFVRLNFDERADVGVDWLSTVRARAGLAIDDVLVYVTGGLAAARIETAITAITPGSQDKVSFAQTRLGLVGGVGAEFALARGWSATTELLYVQFRNSENSFRDSSDDLLRVESHDSAWISRAGLNYRWHNHAGVVPRKDEAAPCGAARFSGGYAGANAGALRRTALMRDMDGYLEITDTTGTETGWAAGAQMGYDWQSCRKVFGIVADWNWADADTRVRTQTNDNGVIDRSTASNMDWFSTVRARAGLAVDDTLIYITGGLAAAKINATVTNIGSSNTPSNEQLSLGDLRWGWTGGAGVEFALANGWSVNSEILFLQFQKQSDTIVSPADNDGTFSFDQYDTAWVGRVGVNYRWDAGRRVQ